MKSKGSISTLRQLGSGEDTTEHFNRSPNNSDTALGAAAEATITTRVSSDTNNTSAILSNSKLKFDGISST